MNVILVGMPGSGKTSVSAILGELLPAEVLDTDELIVAEYGAISEIFSKHGEDYFRNLETQAVKRACAHENAVISTGGGSLLKEENAALFKSCGKIIYLKASLDALLNRVRGDTRRPLLVGDAKSRLEILLNERRYLYERYADIIIDTDDMTPREVAIKIMELLNEDCTCYGRN